MRTTYSEDQQALAAAFADLFTRESTPERVRAAEARGGFDAGLWSTLSAAGAPGMAVELADGGGGGSLVDAAVVAYEWGRRIAPVPLLEHAVTARLLGSVGAGEMLGSQVVRAVASGDLLATLALRPPQPGGGAARLVPAGAVAGVVVAFRGSAVVASRSDPPRTARPNIAGLPLAHRDLSGAAVIARGRSAQVAWDRALAEWKALMAVAYCGLGGEVLDMGVAYVKQRHQFGVPVGSFQAVQHGLADAATGMEGARLLAWRAVCAQRDGLQDGARLAAMALLFAAEAARFAADRALQYHGGYGYSSEYDVQLYYRRAAGWLLQLGEPALEYARLAEAELGARPGPGRLHRQRRAAAGSAGAK